MKACANLSYQAEQMNDEVGYEQARGIEVFVKSKMRDFRGILSKQSDWITFLWAENGV